MTIIEKRDVKNHLSVRHSRDIFLCAPLSQPDATGYSVVEADETEANLSQFAKDYCADHTIAAVPATLIANLADSVESEVSELSKNARP